MRRIALALACLIAVAPATVADAAKRKPKPPRMQLLSRSGGGTFPNGPSHNGVFSQDRQLASYAAYDSEASNIVRGDTNGFTDVFLVRRAKPYSDKGELWARGKTTVVSRAGGGGPADGPSYAPDIDGEQGHRPRCIAFISEASNLVRGDTNGVADAFVKNLHTGHIERVSVNAAGEQANGPTTEVKVDGHCERVAFVADATNLALTQTTKLAWQSSVTGVPAAGTRQVYVRIVDDETDNAGLSGLTFLASAAPDGSPANGNSDQISFARSAGGCGRAGRCGNFSGESVFFASRATNLSANDPDPGSDIYERTFPRRFVRLRFPRPHEVDGKMVRSTLVGVGPLQMATRVVSITQGGQPANGPSDEPAVTDSGHYVAFRTSATNLLGHDDNRQPDVVRLNTLDGSYDAVSRTRGGTLGNGPSARPAIGRTGKDIVFESAASNFDQNDKNCTADIYHLDFPANNQILSSLDSADSVPNAPFGTTEPCPPVVAAPMVNPRVSYYLNYMVLESSYPLLDRPLARRALPGVDRAEAARMSNEEPRWHQVYLRFLSPR